MKIENSLLNITSSNNSNFIRTAYENYPQTVLTTLLLSSYAIPRILDRDGGRNKKPLLKRFFTITLPDNVAIATLMVINSFQHLGPLKNPIGLLFTAIWIAQTSKILELTRTAVAWGVDKVADYQNFIDPYYLKEFSEFIGPRDFYAREISNR